MFEIHGELVTFRNEEYGANFSLRKESLDLSILPPALSGLRHVHEWQYLSDFHLYDSADEFCKLEHLATVLWSLNNSKVIPNLWCWTKISQDTPWWMAFIEGGFIPIYKSNEDNQWIMVKSLESRGNACGLHMDSHILSAEENDYTPMFYVLDMKKGEVEDFSTCPLLYQMFNRVKMIQSNDSADNISPFIKARAKSHLLKAAEGLNEFYGQMVMSVIRADDELDMMTHISAGFVPLLEYARTPYGKDVLMGKIVPRNR